MLWAYFTILYHTSVLFQWLCVFQETRSPFVKAPPVKAPPVKAPPMRLPPKKEAGADQAGGMDPEWVPDASRTFETKQSDDPGS
jgi:hypothetical protein